MSLNRQSTIGNQQSPRHRRLRWTHRLETFAVALAYWPLAYWPLGLLDVLARVFAVLAFDLLRARRRLTLANVARAFPDMPPAARRRIGRASFRHMFLSVVEFARLSRPKRRPRAEMVVAIEGEENGRRVLERGSFVVSLGHLGNWEFLAHYWAERGVRLAAIYKPLHNPILDAWLLHSREGSGIDLISTRLGGRALWKALTEAARRGGGVCFLMDQDARRQGIFVPFFGQPASTPTGAATLALRLNLPIIPVFCLRAGPCRFRIVLGAPIEPPAGGRTPENVEALTRRQVEALEAAVRRNPEQYFWVHDRWKTRPK
ncbi:MAG: lysophospholipid acyltransferase family protein [Candidatus Sumerlaeota bacterium]|nr:lysophospholipid acyltransferase family protein [Candidatus Sumerlaeota bacterium]